MTIFYAIDDSNFKSEVSCVLAWLGGACLPETAATIIVKIILS